MKNTTTTLGIFLATLAVGSQQPLGPVVQAQGSAALNVPTFEVDPTAASRGF